MRYLLLLLAAVPLAACDPGPRTQPKQTITVRSAGQDRLHQLNELQRDIALKRAIMESGAECRQVSKSGYVGEYKNTSYWTATCVDKFNRPRDWALFVGADETVQLRLCADVAKVGLPACVIKQGATGPSPLPATPAG